MKHFAIFLALLSWPVCLYGQNHNPLPDAQRDALKATVDRTDEQLKALEEVLKTATPQQRAQIQAILRRYELRMAPLRKQLQELQGERDKNPFRLIKLHDLHKEMRGLRQAV